MNSNHQTSTISGHPASRLGFELPSATAIHRTTPHTMAISLSPILAAWHGRSVSLPRLSLRLVFCVSRPTTPHTINNLHTLGYKTEIKQNCSPTDDDDDADVVGCGLVLLRPSPGVPLSLPLLLLLCFLPYVNCRTKRSLESLSLSLGLFGSVCMTT